MPTRAPPRGGTGLVIYEWMAREGYLAASLFPAATFLPARSDEAPDAVLGALPPGTTHFLFHLGATATAGFPASRSQLLAALAARRIETINDRVTDISKPFIQHACETLSLPSTLAAPTMPPETPVFVKTSLNFGGKAERSLPPAELQRMGMHLSQLVTGPSKYSLMRLGDVPSPWWDDPSLCIERFVSNDHNRWHRAIVWQDRLVVIEGINRWRTKKLVTNSVSRNFYFTHVEGRYRTAGETNAGIERLLGQLAVFMPAFGLQFGAVDIVSDNRGEHYIIDVNTTPYFLVKVPEILGHLNGAST